jgi:thioester reductase-like protein
MESFPITPNGKTDLRALPEAKLLMSEDYEPPANDTEADFCDMFASVLGLERVGANDSFFAIGGTSLSVTQLTIAAMQKGYDVGYGEVFANPTPRLLAEICTKAEDQNEESSHERVHDQNEESSHERVHDQNEESSHERAHDQNEESSHERAYVRNEESSHGRAHGQNEEASHGRAHDQYEETNHEKGKNEDYVTYWKNMDIGDDGFDYRAINELLSENTIDSLIKGDKLELGNICLTGATGFLGIHVLYEFLNSERGAAYCIVRGKKSDSVKRLKSLLVYYFSNSFDELFGSRIVVVEGDVTSPDTYAKLKAFPIDTLINCAANVKHFSAGTDIEDINVGGVRYAVDYCKETGARLIHVSTASIAGMSVDGNPKADTVLNERMLWFGQDISNQYVHSKFMAERIILSACAAGELDAKIMRAGNLMARASDGEFQVNFNTNSFLGMLKAYSMIGRIPYETMTQPAEFAPIDCTAEAILRLAKTPKECRVFHPYNDHEVFLGDAVKSLESLGIHIQPSEKCKFSTAFSEAMTDVSKAKDLRSLIAYNVRGKVMVNLKSENTFTSQALLRCGFMWPMTGSDYLEHFFKGVAGLGYFDM